MKQNSNIYVIHTKLSTILQLLKEKEEKQGKESA